MTKEGSRRRAAHRGDDTADDTTTDDARAAAVSVAAALGDVKAEDVRVLDVQGLTDVTNVMVLATGSGERHVRALADAARAALRERGRKVLGSEGSKDSGWMVIDAADVVTHVFSRSMRRYYDLDGLWADAAEIEVAGARGREGPGTDSDRDGEEGEG